MNTPQAPRVDLVVMLAGGLKPSPLASAAGRSVLDLSVDGQRTVLEHWIDHLAAAFGVHEDNPVPVRIVHGSNLAPSPLPEGSVPPCLTVSIERESKEFRGPAGVVKDAADALPPEATVLVIEAARWFGGDLGRLLRAHRDPEAAFAGSDPPAVTVAADLRNAPAGIVVLERSTLDPISQLGFMDLKEQWLGRLAETGRTVRVVRLQEPCVVLRNRNGFLQAARAAAGPHLKHDREARPLFGESELGYFVIVSADSRLEPNTSIVDSVIMDGAVVGSGAIVARSVVCPGARVEPNEVLVDQVRAATNRSPSAPNSASGQSGAQFDHNAHASRRGEHSR